MTVSESVAVFPRNSENHAIVKLVGPLFLGLVVNYCLLGIQITQSYNYYKSYRKTDRKWLKAAVGLALITDIIQSICISQACWMFLVEGWGDLNKVTLFPGWGFYSAPLADAITASIVHIFYAQKLWTLLGSPYNYMFTGIVLTLSCTQLIGGIGCSVFVLTNHVTLPEFLRIKTWASIWLFPAAVTDISITAVLSMKLSMSRTGIKETDDLISKLMRLTIETGLATALVQIVDIIVYLAWPLESYYAFPAFTSSKVYSNSMLALLNSRHPVTSMMTWSSGEGRAVDSIRIQTTQTIVVSGGDGVGDKAKASRTKPRSDNERRTAPDAESYASLPFTIKDAQL